MKPDDAFRGQPREFWATVRLVSQRAGYTVRGKGQIRVPTLKEIVTVLERAGLRSEHLVSRGGRTPTSRGSLLQGYFAHRASVLNEFVEPRLMDADEARETFERLRDELKPKCPLPMNKQTGDKKNHAYLTGITNMLIEANAAGLPCDYDPRELAVITRDGFPIRTLARRVDGAFPSTVNPIALWEIKEYYYTRTFGSRVADGVYETLVDGIELEELREHEGIEVKHYLMVDSHYTWWECGKSYLCRIVDMLHMGLVDEALFGKEVLDRLPEIVAEWVRAAHARGA